MLVLMAWSGRAASAPLPDDSRLGTARAELQAIVDGAERSGLPAGLLADKIREGLAKQVPQTRIVAVVRALSASLDAARREATPHLAAPPPALLKAIVDAHALAAQPADVQSVLKAAAPHGAQVATHAVEALADLAQRGFPAALAAHTVAEVAARRPPSLAQLPAQAEALSRREGVTRAEALDALFRASAEGVGMDHAGQFLHGRDVGAQDEGRGPNRETTGGRGPGQNNGQGHGHGRP